MTTEQQADVVVVRWSPEPADLREIIARPAFRRQYRKAMLVPAVLVVVGLLLALDASHRTTATAVIAVGGALLLFLSLLHRRQLRLRWRSDPLTRDPVEYVFDAQGVLRRQADHECRWGWSRILNVEESPGAFILLLGDGRPSDGPVVLIAKRGIASPADESRLRTLLARHTPTASPGSDRSS